LVRPAPVGAAVQLTGKVKVVEVPSVAPVTVMARAVEVLLTAAEKVPFVTPLMQTLCPVV